MYVCICVKRRRRCEEEEKKKKMLWSVSIPNLDLELQKNIIWSTSYRFTKADMHPEVDRVFLYVNFCAQETLKKCL